MVEGEALLEGDTVEEEDAGNKIMGAFWFGTFLWIAGKIAFTRLTYSSLQLNIFISALSLGYSSGFCF